MLGACFTYLEHGHRVSKKFSDGIWKKSWVKNRCFEKKSQPDFETYFFQNSCFCTFACIYFVWDIVWPCSKYLKLAPDIVLYASKKIKVIRYLKQNIFKEKYKSWILKKNMSQDGVGSQMGLLTQTPIFDSIFFSNASRKCFIDSMAMFKVFKSWS